MPTLWIRYSIDPEVGEHDGPDSIAIFAAVQDEEPFPPTMLQNGQATWDEDEQCLDCVIDHAKFQAESMGCDFIYILDEAEGAWLWYARTEGEPWREGGFEDVGSM